MNTLFQKLSVQFLQILNLWQRHTYIAPDITHEVFYQSLFVSGGWIAEDRLKSVMCRQLLVVILRRCMGAEPTLDRNTGIVKDNPSGDAAVILEGMDDGIQKTLQILRL